MEKRTLVIAIVVAVGVFGSVTFAGGPLGPPRAFVGRGKWLVGIEYAHEDMDLKSTGSAQTSFYDEGAWTFVEKRFTKFHIEHIESHLILGSLAYGLCDNWDVYVRLGKAANTEDDIKPAYGEGYEGEKYAFDGGHGLAGGVGTRATFCQSGPWTFGAVGQVTWVNPDDDDVSWSAVLDGDNIRISGKIKLDWRQFQAGLGVTYQADGWWVYGGPCLFLVNGDLDATLTETTDGLPQYLYKYRHELREESEFGGWIGVGCNSPQNATCYAECQIYGDGWAIGAGVLFPLAVQ